MCNLYSITTNQAAIIASKPSQRDRAGEFRHYSSSRGSFERFDRRLRRERHEADALIAAVNLFHFSLQKPRSVSSEPRALA